MVSKFQTDSVFRLDLLRRQGGFVDCDKERLRIRQSFVSTFQQSENTVTVLAADSICEYHCVCVSRCRRYGVATISRLLKIIGLF